MIGADRSESTYSAKVVSPQEMNFVNITQFFTSSVTIVNAI